MDALQKHLAQTLRTQRALRNWSLSEAANITGVSKAMLGQIERGESSPTIATLWKIATGFNLPFTEFINETELLVDSPHADKRRAGYLQPNRAMQVETLFPFDPETGFEALIIGLTAGAVSESTPHEVGVIEHIIIIEGVLKLNVAGEEKILGEGDALRFDADRPHCYRNDGAGVLRFYNLIHYPRHHLNRAHP